MENFFAEVGQELTDEQLNQVTGGSTGLDFITGLVPSSVPSSVPAQYQSLVGSRLSQAQSGLGFLSALGTSTGSTSQGSSSTTTSGGGLFFGSAGILGPSSSSTYTR